MQVAVHAGRRFDHAADLLLALRPEPRHGLAFLVQVLLHVGELLDDGLDAMPEPGPGQVLIDQLHLGLLTFTGLPRRGEFDQGLTQSDGHGYGVTRIGDPDVIHQVE